MSGREPTSGLPPEVEELADERADEREVDELAQTERSEAARAVDDAQWRRLSWRMLFVHPLSMLLNLTPLFLISILLGSHRSNYWFEIAIVGLVVFFAVLRWLSTSYSVGPTHLVLKKGFFSRQVVTIPRDRVRSVDTESDLFHRLLRVTIVEVGTGQRDQGKSEAERFRLDAIATSEVEPLRDRLLERLRHLDPALTEADESQWGSRYGEDIARLRPTWARFAPFSPIGFGVLFSLWLLTWQMGDMHQRIMALPVVDGTESWLDSLGQPWAFLGRCVAVWLVAGVLAVVAYLIRYGKYALTDHGRVLYVQNGVLRRKHQALDKDRLRGVEIRLPVFLRLFGGGRLEPIMTGTKNSGSRGSTLLPQAPLTDVHRVATRILGDDAAVRVPLRRHGFVAARRRITRGLIPFYIAIVVGVLVRLDRGASVDPWLRVLLPAAFVLAVALSIDRIRMLGHALLPDRLVTSHGSWGATRVVLDAEGIIAWGWSQTPFQRWAGLVNIHAATPAGAGGYLVLDMKEREAWGLAETLTPGITDVWGRFGDDAEGVSLVRRPRPERQRPERYDGPGHDQTQPAQGHRDR